MHVVYMCGCAVRRVTNIGVCSKSSPWAQCRLFRLGCEMGSFSCLAKAVRRCDEVELQSQDQQPGFGPRLRVLRALLQVSQFRPRQEGDSQANVSSMLTMSLALVSMNPHPFFLAHSSPVCALTTRAACKSHLLPATILTGGTLPLSMRFSSSMSIISM